MTISKQGKINLEAHDRFNRVDKEIGYLASRLDSSELGLANVSCVEDEVEAQRKLLLELEDQLGDAFDEIFNINCKVRGLEDEVREVNECILGQLQVSKEFLTQISGDVDVLNNMRDKLDAYLTCVVLLVSVGVVFGVGFLWGALL